MILSSPKSGANSMIDLFLYPDGLGVLGIGADVLLIVFESVITSELLPRLISLKLPVEMDIFLGVTKRDSCSIDELLDVLLSCFGSFTVNGAEPL